MQIIINIDERGEATISKRTTDEISGPDSSPEQNKTTGPSGAVSDEMGVNAGSAPTLEDLPVESPSEARSVMGTNNIEEANRATSSEPLSKQGQNAGSAPMLGEDFARSAPTIVDDFEDIEKSKHP